ncbi:MAG: enolase C-terminal domain-like protein [Pirellulales bacterium]
MPKPTDIRIVDACCQTRRFDYRTPIKFGGRVVTDAVLLDVNLVVETRDGRIGRGHGSMPMGNVWAWPSQEVALADTLTAITSLGEAMADEAGCDLEAGHPLRITHQLGQRRPAIAEKIVASAGLPEPIPLLAQLVAVSPLEAAVHDAYGKALGQNAYDTLGEPFVDSDLATWLGEDFRGEYLDAYTQRKPKQRMPLYHLVGALDPLTHLDVAVPIDDPLPETLAEWIVADGLTHLKIKLAGDDLPWDVDRVVSVDRVAAEAQSARNCSTWWYSLDFNEKCSDVAYVIDFLRRVREAAPDAFDRVQYIEQPTNRDLRANPESRMHEAARIKPVVIDESLVDLESLLLSREMGYSGVALKACKGQSEALLMAAAAQKYGMFLCVQDLTCIGASFLHSASLAARVPTVAAIEGNGRQYCPAGNRDWEGRFPTMFRLADGTIETGVLTGPGLGY